MPCLACFKASNIFARLHRSPRLSERQDQLHYFSFEAQLAGASEGVGVAISIATAERILGFVHCRFVHGTGRGLRTGRIDVIMSLTSRDSQTLKKASGILLISGSAWG